MKPSNLLNIKTLHKGWSDKDNVMLHACFQLLTDCVEKEELLKLTDWAQNEELISAKTEIDELLNWWKNRLKAEKDGLDWIWDNGQYQKDTDMMVRLVKIRKFLWI